MPSPYLPRQINKTVGAWNPDSGYSTMSDWLHEDNDTYYKKRKDIAAKAMLRAQEMAATQYPISILEFIKTHPKSSMRFRKKQMQPFIDKGLRRIEGSGKSGKSRSSIMSVIRDIQTNILSSLISKYGNKLTAAQAREAGEDGGSKTVGMDNAALPLPMFDWEQCCGYESLDNWLHEKQDKYYAKRRRIANLALKRAEELAATYYPYSAERLLNKRPDYFTEDRLDLLEEFIGEGKKWNKKNKYSGKTSFDLRTVARQIQMYILSKYIGEFGDAVKDVDIRCANLKDIDRPKAACPIPKDRRGLRTVGGRRIFRY